MKQYEFTQDQIDQIVQLPIRSYNMGGTKKNGYYDINTGKFYLIDAEGKLTGFVGKVSKKTERPPVTQETPVTEQEPEKDPKKKKPADNKKTAKALFIVVAAIVVVFGGLFGVSRIVNPVSAAPAQDPQATEEAAPAGIDILKVTKDIIKGDLLEESMFEVVTVSPIEYNQLLAAGVLPCKGDDMDTILGLYAAEYISAEQFMSSECISIGSPIASNPWGTAGEEYAFLTLSVEDMAEDHTAFYGAVGALDIVRKVSTEEAKEEEAEEVDEEDEEAEEVDPEEVEGLTISSSESQSVVVTSYRIDDVVICDVLNEEGNSVYPYYARYLELTEIKQYAIVSTLMEDDEFMKATTPCHLVVRVTAEQAAVIGDIVEDDVTLTLNGAVDADTDEETVISSGTLSIMNIILGNTAPEEQ